MKLKNPLLAVKDIKQSISFYNETLGLRVVMDFGANVTLTGGLCLQTQESWAEFLGVSCGEIAYGGNDAEIYFEEDDFDRFLGRLSRIPGIEYVHPVVEHAWGQRAVRFYDPDRHIIEVGENMKAVVRRFLESGMTVQQAAVRMDVPEKFIRACIK